MKLIKIVTLILAAAFLCIGLASGASAESTPYEEAVARYERMKVSAINIGLEYEGAYTTKASYFYAREVTGVAEDGSFILGPWCRIREATYVMGYSETYFNLPGTYVMFGYSFDIMWGDGLAVQRSLLERYYQGCGYDPHHAGRPLPFRQHHHHGGRQGCRQRPELLLPQRVAALTGYVKEAG